jgi:hypothetical protein
LQNSKAKEEDDERVAAATFEACTFATYQVNAIGYKGFKNTEVLLDNQANISIMKPDLLRAFGKVEEEIKISGVGGVQLSTNTTGYLEDFFRVFVSSETKANVLSFAEVEDMYEINYVPCTSFVVHLLGRDIEFVRKGKLYVADFSDHYHYQANLTKQEFVKPDEAHVIQVNVTKQVVTKAE